jgi:2-iminobutanoate/2-iminopropanoate deaminase
MHDEIRPWGMRHLGFLNALLFAASLGGIALTCRSEAEARQPGVPNPMTVEYIGKSVRGVPVSPAVKAGKFVFVSGTPAFDKDGRLAIGDFPAQMKQVMENVTNTLKSSGTDWGHVVMVNVVLTRKEDFGEMNRIYATYFPSGKYPARTTVVVSALPSPDFLLEIECQAVLD